MAKTTPVLLCIPYFLVLFEEIEHDDFNLEPVAELFAIMVIQSFGPSVKGNLVIDFTTQ